MSTTGTATGYGEHMEYFEPTDEQLILRVLEDIVTWPPDQRQRHAAFIEKARSEALRMCVPVPTGFPEKVEHG